MMTARSRGPRLRQALLASVVALSSLAIGPVDVALAATDRLPDLRAGRIRDLRIETLGSRRVLRFTGIMWNMGEGPLEIRASRPAAGTPWTVDQVIADSGGRTRRIGTTANLRYAGDGHDHWHVRRVMSYHLWGDSGTLRDAKIGFCFFDTNLVDGKLPRSPTHSIYTQQMCGTRGSLRTRGGISVGWGDRYPWDFAYQWIDITGLPAGKYTLRVAVDLYGMFTEVSDTNNCAWSRIVIGAAGTSVSVLASGKACVNDHDATAYAQDVAWALQAGVAAACDADMFCTNDTLTRGQLASFIANAYDLPPATRDWFSDDDGDPDEDAIDRVAEAGLMAGCKAGSFCPDRPARRDQVARAVATAVALPPATIDLFDDDAGRALEPAINAVAQAGIMPGCAERRFCPTGSVSRGQAARYLRASLEPTARLAP